jgi:tRNA dimethylallyltransferase
MSSVTPLYLLSGPTASGKTSVAHVLADRMGLRLLSVDSMMVYRGMDIGTAKPTSAEQIRYDYAGVNLVEPGGRFSTGDWIRAISGQLDERPTLAVGGTGLYLKALLYGLEEKGSEALDDLPSDVAGLQAEILRLDDQALRQIADPENPRRLQRALMWLRAGKGLPTQWKDQPEVPIPVLKWPTEELNQRIETRIEEMFAQGLLEECRGLLEQHEGLQGTAGQAIGYAEAFAVLSGEMTQEEAVRTIATRTRRYAKRQRTWFRNQMSSRWIEVSGEDSVEGLADRVAEVWDETGPFLFSGENA